MNSFFLFPGLSLVCFLYGNGNFVSFTIQDSDDCDLEHEDRRTKRKRVYSINMLSIYLHLIYRGRPGIYITLIG